MTKPFQVSRKTPQHRTRVRNALGVPLKCCWDECQSDGYDEIKVIVRDGPKQLHYIFCSENHKRYHISGHRTYGMLKG